MNVYKVHSKPICIIKLKQQSKILFSQSQNQNMGSSKSQPKSQSNTYDAQTQTSSTTQKKPHVVTKTKQQPKSPQQQIISDKQINNIVDSVSTTAQPRSSILVEDYVNSIQKHLNPALLYLQQHHKTISNDYLQPISRNYNQIPSAITDIKFTYLNCYNYNDRLTALGLAAMIVGVASFRTAKVYQLPLQTFTALKDATLAYFIGGLVIAPEIFNPLTNSNI